MVAISPTIYNAPKPGFPQTGAETAAETAGETQGAGEVLRELLRRLPGGLPQFPWQSPQQFWEAGLVGPVDGQGNRKRRAKVP